MIIIVIVIVVQLLLDWQLQLQLLLLLLLLAFRSAALIFIDLFWRKVQIWSVKRLRSCRHQQNVLGSFGRLGCSCSCSCGKDPS